jgi:glutamate synthase (NADPH/NADH) large chain
LGHRRPAKKISLQGQILSNFGTTNQGLYDSSFEHDACGVALVATLNKKPTHEIVSSGLEALRNLEHRGASGSEPDSGDGAGILIQIPDEFFKSCVDFKLPENGFYAAGIVFLPQNEKEYKKALNNQRKNITIAEQHRAETLNQIQSILS